MRVDEDKLQASIQRKTESLKAQSDEAPDSAKDVEDVADAAESARKAEISELRLNWSRNFLERGGLQYIMREIYALDVTSSDKKQIEFMLTLARVFLSAAFATDPKKQIGQAVKLVRKSSSI